MNRIFLFGIIFGLSLIGQSAFAESDPSISISVDTVNMTLQPGEFGTTNQTITASTTSSSGYTIELANNNNSTDLIVYDRQHKGNTDFHNAKWVNKYSS